MPHTANGRALPPIFEFYAQAQNNRIRVGLGSWIIPTSRTSSLTPLNIWKPAMLPRTRTCGPRTRTRTCKLVLGDPRGQGLSSRTTTPLEIETTVTQRQCCTCSVNEFSRLGNQSELSQRGYSFSLAAHADVIVECSTVFCFSFFLVILLVRYVR